MFDKMIGDAFDKASKKDGEPDSEMEPEEDPTREELMSVATPEEKAMLEKLAGKLDEGDDPTEG